MAATASVAAPMRENVHYVPDATVDPQKFPRESSTSAARALNVETFQYDIYIQPLLEEGTFAGFVNISFNAIGVVTHVSFLNVFAPPPALPRPLINQKSILKFLLDIEENLASVSWYTVNASYCSLKSTPWISKKAESSSIPRRGL